MSGSCNTLRKIMVPRIQILAKATLRTFQNVLKQRVDVNRILKEREKKVLSREGYRRLKVDLNNKQFLQLVDSKNTKASIYYIRQKFIRYACKTSDL
jgi:hypothetical protein